MDNADGDRDRALGTENSAAEGDGDRGSRYGLARCASQSSLDESSQRAARAAREGGAGGAHAAALLAALARMRAAGSLCDVRLQAQPEGEQGGGEGGGEGAGGGGGVWAHRAVLAGSSPYFLAMFTQFEERTRAEVTIQGVEPGALEAIVDYMYTPESLVVTEHNVQALLGGASLLAVGGVRAACCRFLGAALAPDNALGIRAFADLHAAADLTRLAHDYIDAHFAQVLEAEEFLALTPDALALLLASDNIVVPDEEVVLDAVIKWMQHEPERRAGALGALLEHVRLPLLSRETLVARAGAAPLGGPAADARVKDLVIEALSFHLAAPARRAQLAARCARARPRAGGPVAGGAALLVAGGQAPKAVRDAELLRLGGGGGAGAWSPARALPSRRCRAGLAVAGRLAYVVGGFNGTLRVRSVDVYDPAADAWRAGPPLQARRSTLGVAVLDDVIYAVGGFDGASGLSSAEALDVGGAGGAGGSGEWRSIASMSTRRSSVGVGVLGGRLYAVGGYDGAARQCLHSVERYEPARDAWAPVASMAARRSGCGVGVAGGALYAAGGHDGPAVRRSVERYRPDGDWAPAPPMHSARRNAAVAAHRDRLYAVGGDDGAANLDTVEVFDPTTDTWTLLNATMSLGRSYAAVAVLDAPPDRPERPERDERDERLERDERTECDERD